MLRIKAKIKFPLFVRDTREGVRAGLSWPAASSPGQQQSSSHTTASQHRANFLGIVLMEAIWPKTRPAVCYFPVRKDLKALLCPKTIKIALALPHICFSFKLSPGKLFAREVDEMLSVYSGNISDIIIFV